MTKIGDRLLGIMILRQIVKKVSRQDTRSYPAPHCGSPGEVGGSRPRDECAAVAGTADEVAAQKYKDAVTAEPTLTKLVRRLTRKAGGKVYDLKHRLKSEASLTRKIAGDMAEKGIMAETAAKAISDHVRYTSLFESDKFVASVLEVQTQLKAEGWTKYDHKWKNFWQPGDAYDGYNTVYVHGETGQRFEWQFHTPESIIIKDNGHKLYERARVMKQSLARTVLLRQMNALWEVDYAKPHGWERLPGILIGGRR